MKRIFIMIFDSFGIGTTKDASKFGGLGPNTLGRIATVCQQRKSKLLW